VSIAYRFYDAFVKESHKCTKHVVPISGQKNAPVDETGAFWNICEAKEA